MTALRDVLVVHQSAELYGSDKVIANVAKMLPAHGFRPFMLLPEHGPLERELTSLGVEYAVVDLVKISRRMFSPSGLLALAGQISNSLRQLDRVCQGRKFDLVYSNTVAVLSGALWARRHGIPHLWHVHEIIERPWLVARGIPWIVERLSRRVLANSHMTTRWLVGARRALKAKTVSVWNGIEAPPPEDHLATEEFRREAEIDGALTTVALVGRINRWKGQEVLVAAATLLHERGVRNVRYVIVGSPPPGQDEFLHRLEAAIEASPGKDAFRVLPFREDVWSVWRACDIAVVPSTEPEPFGMVAIEAMAVGKPVIAANHGGLVEIVDAGVTGELVQPADPVALADAIERLVSQPALRAEMGRRGELRQRELFSLEQQVFRTVAEMRATIAQGETDA